MIEISLAASGRLALHFPDGHTITLPWTPKGMICLRRILMARAAKPQRPQIGTRASPTQWDIDQWLRQHSLAAELNIDLTL